MDEYIRRQDALEIVKRTCGDYAAAFAEISRLSAADLVEQSYKEGHTSGYYEGLNDGEKSRNHGIVMEKLEQLSAKMDEIEGEIDKLRQEYKSHSYRTESVRILPPWWAEPGGKGGNVGGHGGGQW